MSESRSESYKAAGVDVTAGYEAVKLMKPMVESTFTKGVMGTPVSYTHLENQRRRATVGMDSAKTAPRPARPSARVLAMNAGAAEG